MLLALRINVLAKGHSGIAPGTLRQLPASLRQPLGSRPQPQLGKGLMRYQFRFRQEATLT